MAAVVQNPLSDAPKPELVFRIDGFGCDVYDAICLPGSEAILTGSEDRSLRVWMRRDTSRFWPSAMEILPSPVCCLSYSKNSVVHAGLYNGTVVEFTLAADLNNLEHKRDYLSHTARVNQILVSTERNWIFSVSKDQTITWCSNVTGKRCDGLQLEAAGTAVEFDPVTSLVIVGDDCGRIKIIHVNPTSGHADIGSIRELAMHDQAITSLFLDVDHSRLVSGSVDHAVFLWDMKEIKSDPIRLQGHQKECSAICWWVDGNNTNMLDIETDTDKYKGLVVSGGLDGLLIFWFMHPSRVASPVWVGSDTCQLCSTPFFWNVKKMWNLMSVGVRQHHCRRCGKAVCEKCSSFQSSLPTLGFERDVRICQECYPLITDTDRRSLAIFFDARHPIIRVRLDVSQKLLLTVGKDRVVKVWKLPELKPK